MILTTFTSVVTASPTDRRAFNTKESQNAKREFRRQLQNNASREISPFFDGLVSCRWKLHREAFPPQANCFTNGAATDARDENLEANFGRRRASQGGTEATEP